MTIEPGGQRIPSLSALERKIQDAEALQRQQGGRDGRAEASQQDAVTEALHELRELLTAGEVVPFPSDGEPDNISAAGSGEVIFDLSTDTVSLPENSQTPIDRDLGLGRDHAPLRSALVWTDDTVTVRLEPGHGSIMHQATGWGQVYIPPSVQRLVIEFTRPGNLFVLFSTTPSPPTWMTGAALFMKRQSAQTLTKSAAVGTNDSFTALDFVPAIDGAELNPSDAGASTDFLCTSDWVGKTIIFENGANPVDVNIQIRHLPDQSWVDHPATGPSYRVDANVNKVWAINTAAHFFRVRARVAGMVASAQTSDVVVQFHGKLQTSGGLAEPTSEAHQLRPASGNLSAGETTTDLIVPPWAKRAMMRLDVTTITTPDADDEVDYYIQTSYNGGTDYADLANVHHSNADNGNTEIKLLTFDRGQSNVGAVDETDGSLADDSRSDLPLGDRLRIKTAVTGATAPTYAYNAEVLFLA